MIRIIGLSGTMASFSGAMQLWDIATKVKHELGIPRGEQLYYHGYKKLSKSMLIQGPIDLTMVRVRVKCAAGCGKNQRKRKYQACGSCRDVYYCNESCQSEHWKCHKKTCQAVQKEQRVEHEHDYKKVFPIGPRDNNQFDLVCNVCGHVA